MKPPARKLVQCTNDECPEAATAGQPWKGQRKSHRATEEPCPRCSSAVVVATEAQGVEVAVLGLAAAAVALVVLEEGLAPGQSGCVPTIRPALRAPFIGRPTVTCHDPVRYGLAAHQRLEALAKDRTHRGKTRAELIGWALDQWGAGLSDGPGAA